MREKKIICFVLFFVQAVSFAQSFVEDGKQWSVAHFPSIGNTVSTEIFKIIGDTLIGDKIYSKVFVSHDAVNWELYYNFLREESDKIYYYSTFYNQEYLLYDFTIKEQEVFRIEKYNIDMTLDSIRVIEGLKHYFFSFENETTVWIESIGNISNLFVPDGNIGIIGAQYFLLCCSVHDTYVYINNDYSSCFLTTISQPNLDSIRLRFDKKFITIPKTMEISGYEIITVDGRVIDSGTSYTIPLYGISKGMYCVKMYTIHNGTIIQKFVVTH